MLVCSSLNPIPMRNMTWLIFALLTVLSWGVYGVLLHKARGLMPMAAETPHAGLKAFLFVCIAYALIGVVAAILLKTRGSAYTFTNSGMSWSLIAGTAGALGAFTLVLALGAAATPLDKGGGGYGLAAAAAVMPIVFAGAPLVNTVVAMSIHPPEGGMRSLPLPFIAGCILAALGAFLVAKFAPTNNPNVVKPKPALESRRDG